MSPMAGIALLGLQFAALAQAVRLEPAQLKWLPWRFPSARRSKSVLGRRLLRQKKFLDASHGRVPFK